MQLLNGKEHLFSAVVSVGMDSIRQANAASNFFMLIHPPDVAATFYNAWPTAEAVGQARELVSVKVAVNSDCIVSTQRMVSIAASFQTILPLDDSLIRTNRCLSARCYPLAAISSYSCHRDL